MSFIEEMKKKAASNLKTIVLPESMEERNLKATHILLERKIAEIVLLGDKEEILKKAKELGADVSGAIFINPKNYEKKDEFVDKLVELRRKKGLTKEDATKLLLDPLYFGVMLVKENIAQGMVAGAINSTANVLRPALQIIKTAPNIKLVSAIFLLEVPNCPYGEKGMFLFADTALNPDPNSEELAHISLSTAKTYYDLVGKKAKVAMLSFSSYGSAKHPDVDKVKEALKLAKELDPELEIDGELQFDAAIVPETAKLKAPGSKVAGKANVLIFPNLDAANIGYKIAHRLGKAEAIGPITQGIAKPINDLSRGCSVDDIVGTVAITSVQCQNNE